MQVVMRRRRRKLYPKGGYAELRERGKRDDLVRVVLRQNPTGGNLSLLVVQKLRRSAGLRCREDLARHRVGAHPTVQRRLGPGNFVVGEKVAKNRAKNPTRL